MRLWILEAGGLYDMAVCPGWTTIPQMPFQACFWLHEPQGVVFPERGQKGALTILQHTYFADVIKIYNQLTVNYSKGIFSWVGMTASVRNPLGGLRHSLSPETPNCSGDYNCPPLPQLPLLTTAWDHGFQVVSVRASLLIGPSWLPASGFWMHSVGPHDGVRRLLEWYMCELYILSLLVLLLQLKPDWYSPHLDILLGLLY